jgi:alkylglycerol monooxygenase
LDRLIIIFYFYTRLINSTIMHINYLAFSIPFFVSIMLAEYYFSRKQKQKLFSFEEVVANLNVGIAERLSDLFTTGLFYFLFNWLYKNFSLFIIRPNVLTWILLFLFTDLTWYWYHRFGHRVNLFWSAHVVHHQSDDFNFSVSARITVFQAFARASFWSILPVLGFPPGMVTVFLLIHGSYPFFTHTQLAGKLGFLEKFLVTPSHHRVHHSSSEAYLDKNYGDILIIWDKLFGTFAEETARPVFGLTKPLKSYSFLWQHFHFPLEMMVAFKRAGNMREKLTVLFGKPGDIDPRIRTLLEKKFNIHHEVKSNPALNRYLKLQTIITLFLLFVLVLLEHYLTAFQLAMAAIFIIISVINTGAMMEQRRWIFYLEYMRLLVFGIFALTYSHNQFMLSIVASALVGTLLFYRTLSTRYYSLFYECKI